MIIDHRTYTMHPGKLRAWLELWERMALPYQMKYLENFVGMFTCDVGDLNQVVHMWAYASFEERTERRKNLMDDPAWGAYLREAAKEDALVTQETKILLRAPFFES